MEASKTATCFHLHSTESPLPIRLTCLIDTSGSMASGVNNDEFEVTTLNLVKHAIVTMSHVMSDRDQLCIIVFSDDARVVMPYTNMNTDGHKQVESVLLPLSPNGGTNLADGLRKAVEVIEAPADYFDHILLLTDGQPSVSPPQGYQMYAKSLLKPYGHVSLHTVGFGYSINVPLLSDLAKVTGGQFTFISDIQMLGTVFVHLISNLLSTVASRIRIGDSEHGCLQQHQQRDLIHKDSMQSNVTYYRQGQRHSLRAPESIAHLNTQERTLWLQVLDESSRQEVVASLKRKTSPLADAMVRDLESEMRLAFESKNYDKWGQAYVMAMASAHLHQVCTNFKDSSLQQYSGKTVCDYVESGSFMFMKLPAIMMTSCRKSSGIQAVARPIQNQFYDSANVCVRGDSTILLADGSLIKINTLRKGMMVRTGCEKDAAVRCIITSKNSEDMVRLSDDLVITPYHPVNVQGLWQFPKDIAKETIPSYCLVYSILLEPNTSGEELYHTVWIGGVLVACLAHHITQSEVIQHDFFGTDRVIESLTRETSIKKHMFDIGYTWIDRVIRDANGRVTDLV